MMSSYLVDCSEAVHEGEVERAGAVGGIPEGLELGAMGGAECSVRLLWCLAVVDNLRTNVGNEG